MARLARSGRSSSEFRVDDGEQAKLRRRIADLEVVADSLKHQLAQAFQEKSALEEEFQCSNEELQAANADLEATASELEEANFQLGQRVEETKRALSDLQNLLNSTQIATVFLDDDLRIRRFTPAIRGIFNLMDQDIGRPVDDLASGVLLPTLAADARQTFETLRPVVREAHAKDGATIYDMRIMPYRTVDNRIEGVTITFIDVTQYKRADAEAIFRFEAEAANRAKSTFLAAMSHELRTPLNAIIGFSDIIRTQAFGGQAYDKYIEYAGDIYASGIHLLDVVNDILDISKIEAGKVDISPKFLEVRSLLETMLRTVGTQAESCGLSIVMRISDPPPSLYADERAVKQIFLNLLSNAIKFTLEGGKITIAAMPASEGAGEISVHDTGVGIPPDQIHRALRPFERLQHSYAREMKGTGLGLSVVKALAELHGGDVQIESEVDVGTTVRVRFPVPD